MGLRVTSRELGDRSPEGNHRFKLSPEGRVLCPPTSGGTPISGGLDPTLELLGGTSPQNFVKFCLMGGHQTPLLTHWGGLCHILGESGENYP